MADPVTDAIEDIKTKIQGLSLVKDSVIRIYEQDDLIGQKETRIQVPAIGIVYLGLRGKRESGSGPTGLAAELTIDVYLIGGDQCIDVTGGEVQKTSTQLLDDIRNQIKLTKFTRPAPPGSSIPGAGAQRKWTFVMESPAMFQEEVIAYVQRWSTTVLLTN